MNRRRALRSLFCVSFGGAAALILASCEVVTAPDTETTDEVAELPLAEILQRTKALSESIASKVRECNSAGSLTLTVSMVESAALCEFALTRIRRSRSSSPAFWQSCADFGSTTSTSVAEIPVSPWSLASRRIWCCRELRAGQRWRRDGECLRVSCPGSEHQPRYPDWQW